MANQTVFEIVGDARRFVKEMNDAERVALGFDDKYSRLERSGIKTTEMFHDQLVELNLLKKEFKEDALAVAQLDTREKALIRTMKKLNGELDETDNKSGGVKTGFEGIGKGIKFASIAIRAFFALEIVRYLTELGKVGVEASRNIDLMKASIGAATREFGTSTGTLGEWEDTITRLSSKYTHLSENVLRQAVTKVVDLTKRYGFQRAEMEDLLDRTINLSFGKENLLDSLEKVTAAMRGEARSAERLGLTLEAPQVEAFLLANGFKKELIPAMNELQKAQVRYIMFQQQTEEIRRNASELVLTEAGRMEVLSAKYDKAKNKLGEWILKQVEASGVLDLLSGDTERYFTLNVAALDIQRQQNAALEQRNQLLRGMVTRTGQVTGEGEKQLSIAEQIAAIMKEVLAAGGGKGIKTFTGEATKETAQLKRDLQELTGESGRRLAMIEAQNRRLQTQISIAREIGRAFADPKQSKFAPLAKPDSDFAREAGATQGNRQLGLFASPEEKAARDKYLQEMREGLRTIAPATAEAMQAAASANREALEQMGVDWGAFLTGTETGLQTIQDVASSVGSVGDVFGTLFDISNRKAQEHNQQIQDLAASYREAGHSQAEALALAEKALGGAEKANKSYWTAYKAFAIAEAIASTYVAINQALATVKPTVPAGVAASVAIGLAGFANVARIIATQPGGAGGGGAANVAISQGGTSSPGITSGPNRTKESVTSPTPSSVAAADRSASGNNALVQAIEANTRAVNAAIADIPGEMSLALENQAIVISYDRGKAKQKAGLGAFG